MTSKLPSTLSELAEAYDFGTKYMSQQFKKLAYSKDEKPPKKLGILSPKRVIVFYDKFGKPDNLPN